jgi:predicted permease
VAPQLGRVPRDEEMVRGAGDRLVVLSHAFWRREFGGASSVVGRKVTLDGESYEVVGVMPESFRFPSPRVEIFIPYSTIPDDDIPRVRPNRVLGVVARMKPGVTVGQAAAEMSAVVRGLAEQYPDETRDATQASVAPLHEALVGNVRTGLLVLLGAVGFVLLIAAVNLAGLLLARATARERELAVRVAHGAGRGRVVRQLVTESLGLSALGGLAGLAVAYVGARGLVVLAAGQLPRSEDVGLDAPVVLFTLGVSLLTGLIFGLVPAIRAASPDLQQSLREGARGSTRASGGVRDAFVVAEVALAMILVVGAGLMARSFVKLTQVDLGFVPEQRVAVTFSLSDERHPAPGEVQRVYQEILDRVRAVPGVVAAGAVRDLPFRGDGEPMEFAPPGVDPGANGELPKATRMFATGGFFAAMGMPLIAGRDLARTDVRGAPYAVVVNQALARRYFGGRNPVGQSLRFRGDTTSLQIVGLVGDVRQTRVDELPSPRIYFSVLQIPRSKVNLVARTREEPSVAIKRITDAIRAVDPQQTITASFTLEEAVGDAVARPRLLTVLLGVFGATGLVLGALGIYGVLAYLVGQRAREIGVRLALGAHPRAVLRMVLGRGLRLAGIGVALGLVGALLLTRVMAGVLYGVTATDPLTFAAVALALLAVAAVASWLPALRATRVDPLVAMRGE